MSIKSLDRSFYFSKETILTYWDNVGYFNWDHKDPTKFTAKYDSKWIVEYEFKFNMDKIDKNDETYIIMSLLRNGKKIKRDYSVLNNGTKKMDIVLDMYKGDYIQVEVFHNSKYTTYIKSSLKITEILKS